MEYPVIDCVPTPIDIATTTLMFGMLARYAARCTPWTLLLTVPPLLQFTVMDLWWFDAFIRYQNVHWLVWPVASLVAAVYLVGSAVRLPPIRTAGRLLGTSVVTFVSVMFLFHRFGL